MDNDGECGGKSPIVRLALDVLEHIRSKVESGEYSEEDILRVLTKMHPMSNVEYFNPRDFCNADKAMEMLHLGRNRAKFFSMLRMHRIKNYKVNNQPLGYLKADIRKLADELLE